MFRDTFVEQVEDTFTIRRDTARYNVSTKGVCIVCWDTKESLHTRSELYRVVYLRVSMCISCIWRLATKRSDTIRYAQDTREIRLWGKHPPIHGENDPRPRSHIAPGVNNSPLQSSTSTSPFDEPPAEALQLYTLYKPLQLYSYTSSTLYNPLQHPSGTGMSRVSRADVAVAPRGCR